MTIDNTVYFDGDVLELDKTIKIIYKGKLCDSQPEYICMHYGYGLLWENLQEVKLSRNANNYYDADISFCKKDDVYFCFRDSNGAWDNNGGMNYHSAITERDNLALISLNQKYDIAYPRLKKGYFIRKKIKIVFFRTISFIGKLLTGKLWETTKDNF